MAALVFCRGLTENDVTVTPTYSGSFSFLFKIDFFSLPKMSEKHTSTSPNAIQVKNQQKAIGM
jgi:hypothetical protein